VTPTTERGLEAMGEVCSSSLSAMHRNQIGREPWPDLSSFDPSAYPVALLQEASEHWAERARAEHGSVHQFSQVSHALCVARAPLEVQGALARLITDEVRHAELCARMAAACAPGAPRPQGWPTPQAPWEEAPLEGDQQEIYAWAARAVLIACCLGETISRPLLEAVVIVATDPVAEAVGRQILRDEQLHATFGWELLAWLLPRIRDFEREQLERVTLPAAFAALERSTSCGISANELAHTTLTIRRGSPNLGILSERQQAQLFYMALEGEVFAGLRRLGFDPASAWANRH